MTRKVQTIKEGDGYLHIFGGARPIRIDYAKPEWSDEPEAFFRFRDRRCYLGNIMRCDMKGYDGIETWSFSNGMLVRFDPTDSDYVYAYYYYYSSSPEPLVYTKEK
jgi:hypothetical protein